MIALIQIATATSKSLNLQRARVLGKRAAANGAKIIVLPECFNIQYSLSEMRRQAEVVAPSSPTYSLLQSLAIEAGVYVIGGSIPELKQNRIYNSSMAFSPTGELIAVHRKVHLFDINIPGKIQFQESEVLSAGDCGTIIDTEYGKIGIGICYDIRFPELAAIAARNGARMLIYPSAFNLTTGPAHWELLARARALDNQVYVALCSPARDMTQSYHAYGHSLIVNAYGEVIAEAGIDEEIIYAEINLEHLEKCRREIPINKQRRFDVYRDVAQPRCPDKAT